ncbi:MAG: hypothetical protein R2856_25415 [Caldilineaceae bacterium]
MGEHGVQVVDESADAAFAIFERNPVSSWRDDGFGPLVNLSLIGGGDAQHFHDHGDGQGKA